MSWGLLPRPRCRPDSLTTASVPRHGPAAGLYTSMTTSLLNYYSITTSPREAPRAHRGRAEKPAKAGRNRKAEESDWQDHAGRDAAAGRHRELYYVLEGALLAAGTWNGHGAAPAARGPLLASRSPAARAGRPARGPGQAGRREAGERAGEAEPSRRWRPMARATAILRAAAAAAAAA